MSEAELTRGKPKTIGIESTRNSQSTHDFNQRVSQDKRRTRSSFLERNYTSQLHKREHRACKLITESELSSILFTMKNYFNLLSKDNKRAKGELEAEKESHRELIHKEEELRKSKEFSLNQQERIIVMNTVETTDEIKERLKRLDAEFNEIKLRHKNEEEYTSTVNHMIEADKLQFGRINESILRNEAKLHDITKALRVLRENTIQKDVILKDYDKCLTTIDNQIEDVERVIQSQDMKQGQIDHSTQRKEGRVAQLKQNLHGQTILKKGEIDKYKHGMIQRLDEYRFKKAQLNKKEMEFIDLILGMHLLQKYFIRNKSNGEDNNSIDMRSLKESTDYWLFCCSQYSIVDSNDEVMMTAQTARSINSTANKRKKAKLKVEDLRFMLNTLDITSEDLYNYLLRIRANEQFTRETMISLNQKAITLENHKMLYTRKVNEIIAKDYKNFDDLIKLNSRFATFIQSNTTRSQIERKAKKDHECSTYYLINSFVNESHIHPDIREIKQNVYKFIAKSRTLLTNVKAALEDIAHSFVKCKHFKDFDELNPEESLSPVGKKYNQSAAPFLGKGTILNKKEYLLSVLNYSIDKLNNEDALYIKGLLDEAFISKQILDSDWLLEPEVFGLYNSLDRMKIIVRILESLAQFHMKTLKNYDSQHCKIRSSISGPVEFNKMMFNQRGQPEKKVVINGLNVSTAKSKKQEYRNMRTLNQRYHTSNQSEIPIPLDDSFTENNKQPTQRPATSSYVHSNSIVKKLYNSTIKNNQYMRSLNEGLEPIRRNTLRYRKGEFNMSKKWNEIGIIQKEFYPYNNPRINVDSLSCDTYKMITTQILDLAKRRNTEFH